ncbi:MAG: DUF374 domain-containing protein [Planctomycetes bacterium]|nr:DUF374 domain-containing protein [Planctomycetota bacterium]
MKMRNPWLIRLAARAAAVVLRVWLRTLRTEVQSCDQREHPTDPQVERFIYAIWHESLLAPAKMHTNARVMISQSADGEFIAQVCQGLDFGVSRGSSTRGGATGLLEMLRHSGSSHLVLTPDGPRGPRRKVQPGIILLASRTGLPIVPVGVGFTRAWRFGSWDRFAVPWPFSTVTGFLGEPIRVPMGLDRAGVEQHRQRVEAAMLSATHAAEHLAARHQVCEQPATVTVQRSPGPASTTSVSTRGELRTPSV